MANKTQEFLELYKKHFRDRRVKRLLEIGVQYGGSLKLWEDFFPKAEIIGLDNDPTCKEYVKKNFVLGDQTDRKLLGTLGEFDVVIDDGGHTMRQQQETFDILFPKLNLGGLYVIEDLHTSYWPEFFDQELRTTEFLKSLVDEINAPATLHQRGMGRWSFKNRYNIKGLNFYRSIVFIEK